jgi:ABC-type polysaccharide/polyol phosphate export permease
MAITKYSQASRTRPGVIAPAIHLYREARSRWWHIWVGFQQDFASAHARAGLGQVWNFLVPLFPIFVYSTLSAVGFFPSRDGIPPAIYVSIGVTTYYLMIGAIQSPMRAVERRHNLVAVTSYPLIGVVLSSLGELTFEFLVRFAAAILLFVIVKHAAPWNAPLTLLLMVPVLIFSFSIGLGLSILNMVFPDISRILQLILSYAIFISNAIFPIDKVKAFEPIGVFNPLAIYVDNIRHIYVNGELSSPVAYFTISALGVVFLLAACRLFYVMEWRVRSYAIT